MRTKQLFVMSVASVLMFGCTPEKSDQANLQGKVDSLVNIVENNRVLAETINEADALLDSIDKTRSILRTKLWEGTSLEDFTSRMEELTSYVKRSETKMNELETALRAAKQSGVSYSARVKALKDEVENNNKAIAELQAQVNKYHDENENLIKTVDLQHAEIEDKLSQIRIKEGEVAQLEGRINEILAQARVDEADQYFARGEALELAATRTNFAPRKKKAARQQALDMYQMAVLFGKHEAQAKVDELQKKLHKS